MNDNRFLDSVFSALNPVKLLGKIILVIVFVTILALDKLMEFGDKAIAENHSVLFAIYLAYKEALYRAFGTIFPVLKDFVTLNFDLIASQSYFQIGISGFFFILLMLVMFQPVSLIINMFDFKIGQGTSLLFRILITFFVVLIISAIVYYSLGETGIGYVSTINETINATLNTSMKSDIPIITLI